MLRKLAFWGPLLLLVHTHITYPLSLALIKRLRGERSSHRPAKPRTPKVSLIIAAYDEEEVIADKVANALALQWPRPLLEIIVASDGSSDGTVAAAEAAGSDLVLDLPRGGKIATQNAAVEQASGEIVAFSDANSLWEPEALIALVEPFAEPDVAYVCGHVHFLDPDGDNEEGAYWRYEMAVRTLESELGGVTAGNGGIYAVRRSDYIPLGPSRSHDLNLPFMLAKHGKRSLYAPGARAEEKMVPTLEGELRRKRRMMIGLWDIVIGDRMLDPRGYGLLYGFQILSHRALRYLSPLLHIKAFVATLTLVRGSRFYLLALLVQLAMLSTTIFNFPGRPARLARYYVEVTASIALGTWDRFRQGAPGAWEKSEGTR